MRRGEQWDRLLVAQAGVVTLAQAAEHGWTRHAVANRIASGRWSSPHRGVVATVNGRLTYEQRLWAGLCYAGRDATVSHASALWLQDRGWARPSVIHLTVPRMRDAVRAGVARLPVGPQRRRAAEAGTAGVAVVDVDLDGLVIELDGRAGHLEVQNWWGDMLRDDLHTVEGRAVLRFPGFLLLTHPHLVAHVETAALARRGWTGRIRCPGGCPGFDELLRRFRGPARLQPGE